jgi:hypothetical protein
MDSNHSLARIVWFLKLDVDTEVYVYLSPIPKRFACVVAGAEEPHKCLKRFRKGGPGYVLLLQNPCARVSGPLTRSTSGHTPYIRTFKSGMLTLSKLFTAGIEMTCEGSSS